MLTESPAIGGEWGPIVQLHTYRDVITTSLCRKGYDADIVNDAFSDVLLSIKERPSEDPYPFRSDPESMKAWLYRSVQHKVVDFLRRKHAKFRTSVQLPEDGAEDFSVRHFFREAKEDERRAMKDEALAMLIVAVNKLSNEDHGILEELSRGTTQREMAAKKGVHEGTISRRVSLIHRDLRQAVQNTVSPDSPYRLSKAA